MAGSQLDMEALCSGPAPTRRELARVVVLLSLPAMLSELAQIAMEYIDAAMVGSLGASATAAVGLVATTIWLVWGLCGGAAVGFSVQIAQLIGAGRQARARNVLRQGLVCLLAFSVALTIATASIAGALPTWLGGDPQIRADATAYFLCLTLAMPFGQISRLCINSLQSVGDMRTPSILNAVMCLLDVAFNLVLIFPGRSVALGPLTLAIPGAGLGVFGAGLGSALAEVVVCALLLHHTCWKSPELALWGKVARARNAAIVHDAEKIVQSREEESVRRAPSAACDTQHASDSRQSAAKSDGRLRPDERTLNGGDGAVRAMDTTENPVDIETWRVDRRCLATAAKIAGPVCFERAVMGAAQVALTRIVAPLGTVAVAAHALAVTAEALCYMPGYGIGQAATTLVGQSMGANRRDLARRFARTTTAYGMVVMGVAAIAMFAGVPWVMTLFTPDAAVRQLGAAALRVGLLAEPLFAASIVASGALRGAGDTLVPSVVNAVTTWGLRITAAALLAPRFGLVGVWAAMAAELAVNGVVFLARLVRGRWLDRGSVVAR